MQDAAEGLVYADDILVDTKARALTLNETKRSQMDDVLIMDSGGGSIPTVTKRAFHISDVWHGRKSKLGGYQDKTEPVSRNIVNAVTKAHIHGLEQPVLLVLNYATLIDDPDESESLMVPFAMMRHGCLVNQLPMQHGGNPGVTVDSDFLPLQYDGNMLYYNISKPTEHDLLTLESYELTSPVPPDEHAWNTDEDIRRVSKRIRNPDDTKNVEAM